MSTKNKLEEFAIDVGKDYDIIKFLVCVLINIFIALGVAFFAASVESKNLKYIEDQINPACKEPGSLPLIEECQALYDSLVDDYEENFDNTSSYYAFMTFGLLTFALCLWCFCKIFSGSIEHENVQSQLNNQPFVI